MTTDAVAPGARPAAPAAHGARTWRRPFRLDVRYLAPMLITLILVGSNASTGMLESGWKTALAIVTAIGFELVLARLLWHRWPSVASAYITGISVGILVRSPYYWPFFLTSGLAITSKYLFQYRGRHIFNPSNMAIVTMLLVAPAVAYTLLIQWGNELALMVPIWLVGLAVLYRLRRLHITLVYVASFVFFAAVRAPITGHGFWAEVAPLTGPMYQLFALFMVTDPATTVSTRRGQMLVVFLVAAMECALRLAQVVHAPYFALFLVGPPALVLERWWRSRPAVAATTQPAPA
jgi:enediyne biosynthesis protein E5